MKKAGLYLLGYAGLFIKNVYCLLFVDVFEPVEYSFSSLIVLIHDGIAEFQLQFS